MDVNKKQYFFEKSDISFMQYVVLLVGFIIVFSYYFSIGFVPEMELSSLISLLVVSFASALGIAIASFVFLVFPSMVWSYFAELTDLDCYYLDNKGLPRFLALFLLFVLPAIAFFSLIIYQNIESIIFNVAILLFFLLFMISQRLDFFSVITKLSLHIASLFLGFLFFIFPLLFIEQSIRNNEVDWLLEPIDDTEKIIIYLIVVIFLAFFNALALRTSISNSYHRFLLPPFILFFLIMMYFIGWITVPKGIMKTYQFGNIETSQIILKEQGCQTIEMLGIKPKCNFSKNICSVRCIKIESRLGKQLEFTS